MKILFFTFQTVPFRRGKSWEDWASLGHFLVNNFSVEKVHIALFNSLYLALKQLNASALNEPLSKV